MEQLELDFLQARLSVAHGGYAEVRTYCLFFRYRPQKLFKQGLCTGEGIWAPCPDYPRCLSNKPRKCAPVDVLRQEDESDGQETDTPRRPTGGFAG